MPNTLSLAQLNSYELLINDSNISGFYTALLNDGYLYAGWAGGVADGDTISGLAALDFLNDTAMMGAVGPEADGLSDSILNETVTKSV